MTTPIPEKTLTEAIDETIADWASTIYYRLRAEEGLDDRAAWIKVIKLLRTQDPLAAMHQDVPPGKALNAVGDTVQQEINEFMAKYVGQEVTPAVQELMTQDACAYLERKFASVQVPEGGKILEHVSAQVIPTEKGTQLRFIGITQFGEQLFRQLQNGDFNGRAESGITTAAQAG